VSSVPEEPVPIDGRTARAVRTRKAIVAACIELVEEGDLEPTAPRVAERAGVSVRSVFQHFDDLEGLFAAVGDRVLENLLGLVLHVDPTLDFERRIPIVVRQRAALLEAITPIRRAVAVNAWDSEEVSNRLAMGHAYLRLEIESAFARELLAAGPERPEVLNALDTVLSWPTWEQLRTTVGLDVDAAAAVVERLCRATLAAHR
jgi:TetR/AcrR family transcriptional regulator, regulator of autoinduction and epiphytic fitness